MSSQQLASCPAWSIPGFLEVRGAHLNISGADALALVQEFGSPLFVFSAPRIRANIDRLQRLLRQLIVRSSFATRRKQTRTWRSCKPCASPASTSK